MVGTERRPSRGRPPLLRALFGLVLAALLLGSPAPPTGSLGTARAYHTATLLANRWVLVAGGNDERAQHNAELYDPSSGTWSPTGSLHTARYSHTATLLVDGWVLIAGGNHQARDLRSTELYNPASGSWIKAASGQTAVLSTQ